MKEAFFFSVTSAVQFTGRAPAGFDTETREIKLHVRGAAGNRAQWEARDV